ncbi:MAG: polysaccharide deacetylase family protein [Oscillospiraceae bacterium]|nr:polysaccharide deacetylase family protein [Oscillospiraceae bacterium]
MKRRHLFRHAAGMVLACIMAVQPSFGTWAADTTDDSKLIALTFDDGPNTTTTNEILDILEKYDAKASFFLIGTNINEESAVSVKRAYDMGCEIDNHTKTHANLPGRSEEEILEEVNFVNEAVYEITGEYPKFFRPPFIATDQTMFDVIDLPFICGYDVRDFMADVTAEQRAESILSSAKDGMIYLMHDAAGNDQTVEALKIVMPELTKQGYEFVTLTELFERQGETPRGDLIYSEVTKYPCGDYTHHQNLYTGEASGDSSWGGWSEICNLDTQLLASLGESYAIEIKYHATSAPQIALQQWSNGASLWATIPASYSNGETACYLASDIIAGLQANGVDYADLDGMKLFPNGGTLELYSIDILVNDGAAPSPVEGDVNADGSFTLIDVVMMQKYLLHAGTLKAPDNGELHKDGVLNGYDLALMKKKIFSENA